MTKRTHPADEFNAKVVAEAIEWTAFTQAGGRVTRRASSETEARIAAQDLANLYGRPALVYAINAAGRQALVTTMQPKKESAMDTELKPMSSAEISQLTAIITGGGFKRANSREAAEKRFLKTAAEAGIRNADEIVKGPFDMAEHVIRKHQAGKPLTIAQVKAPPTPIEPGTPEFDARLTRAEKANDRAEKRIEKVGEQIAKSGKRASVLEAAQRGEIPEAPDFSAETHKRFRKKLAEIVALVEAGDIAGLKAVPINPVSSSPKAMDRYRNLAVVAITARDASIHAGSAR